MRPTRFNSITQLAGVMAGFALTIVLLESQALLTWAERLEVGVGRQQAVAAFSALHRTLAPLGIEKLRQQGLTDLDLLGWSDDPARLKSARDNSNLAALGHACSTPDTPGAPDLAGSSVTTGPASKIPGNSIPLALGVPKITPLQALPPMAADKPLVVALVGDSMMAVGLSDVLLQDSAANPNLRVIKAFKSGTGLARPDVFDWMQEYPAMIGDQQPDVIFVAIGANDGQGFVENGQVLAFGSDAWVRVYQQRTAAFLNLLTEQGARVVWVGLPPMKSPKYDDKTAVINRIAYTVVSQYPQASWWNPSSLSGDESGAYREFATLAGGKTIRIRAADGIHLSDEGAALLAPPLMSWLNAPPPPVTVQLAVPAPQGKVKSPKAVHRKTEKS